MITDKQSLIAAVESYMHRNDASTGNQMDTWLQIAESRIKERVRAFENREASTRDQSHRTPAGGYSLPDDFNEILWVEGFDGSPISPASRIQYGQAVAMGGSRPLVYVIGRDNMTLAPNPPDDYSFRLVYWSTATPLVGDTDTNVLLPVYPDLYLYGVLREGYTWERNADMFANADGKFNDLVEKINATGERERYGPSISVGSNTNFGAFTGTNGGM